MERKNEFNLSRSLQHWSGELRAQRSFTEENIAELQAHLLDQMDALKEKELLEEEAFLLAKHRLGSAPELAGDFKKINIGLVWKERICLMALGLIGYLFLNGLVSTISYYYFYFTTKFNLTSSQFIWGDIAVKITSVLMLTGIGVFIFKKIINKISLEKSVVWGVLALVAVAFLQLATMNIVTKVGSVENFGQIAMSGNMFSILLLACLLIVGLVSAIYVKKEKRRQAV